MRALGFEVLLPARKCRRLFAEAKAPATEELAEAEVQRSAVFFDLRDITFCQKMRVGAGLL